MEMHQVRYFLAVAQELNFSRAAEKCNVSQPSLSRAIQQLEGELGGPLFRRERHLTHVTELGEMVRPLWRYSTAGLGRNTGRCHCLPNVRRVRGLKLSPHRRAIAEA
jgi:Bacterial regulatory helix-turn-helix protein, lysR family